nr:trehalose-6-phosphate synthase [Pantoea agglomerans]
MAEKSVTRRLHRPHVVMCRPIRISGHQLETEAGRINGKYGTLGWTPLYYLNQHFDRRLLMKIFRLTDVGLVTPLRDGMNLVAKEYVAAQDPDDPGVLVLSALLVPPTN